MRWNSIIIVGLFTAGYVIHPFILVVAMMYTFYTYTTELDISEYVDSHQFKPITTTLGTPKPTKSIVDNRFISAVDKQLYLQSVEWGVLRLTIFKRDSYTCQLCPSVNNLECHHITYRRLTVEHPDDLVTLCHTCHSTLHNIKGYSRKRRYPIKDYSENY